MKENINNIISKKMEYGFFIAIMGMLSIAASNIITKKLSLEFDELLSTFFYILSTSFFAYLIFVIFGEYNFYFNLNNNLLLLGAGVSGFFTILFLIKSFAYLSTGIVLTIFNSYYLWNYFYDVLLGNKSFGFILFGVLLLFFFGLYNIFRINIKEKGLQVEFFLPLFASLSLFIFTRINSIFINSGVNSYSTTLMTEGAILLITSIILFFQRRNIISSIYSVTKKQWLVIGGVGFFNYLGVLLLNTSYKYLEVFIVNIINSSQVLVVLVVSYFVFREKIKSQQIFGILCIFVSLILIYYFGKV